MHFVSPSCVKKSGKRSPRGAPPVKMSDEEMRNEREIKGKRRLRRRQARLKGKKLQH